MSIALGFIGLAVRMRRANTHDSGIRRVPRAEYLCSLKNFWRRLHAPININLCNNPAFVRTVKALLRRIQSRYFFVVILFYFVVVNLWCFFVSLGLVLCLVVTVSVAHFILYLKLISLTKRSSVNFKNTVLFKGLKSLENEIVLI